MAAVEKSTSTSQEVFEGTEGQYLLPHHVSEIDRLRRQHEYTKVCCDGNLLGFPLPESSQQLEILDSGCADGEQKPQCYQLISYQFWPHV
jgi:hypothetical protein